jgi:tyrosyl-tRNA synthetase
LEKSNFFLKNHGKAVYCGYDPTSSSLHLGNLVTILMLARLNLNGMRPIFLVGGATGQIGDPSGKNK